MITVFHKPDEPTTDKSMSPTTTRQRAWSLSTVSTAPESVISSCSSPINKEFLINLDEYSHLKLYMAPCNTLRISDFKDISPFAEGTNAVLYKARVDSKYIVVKMIKKTLCLDPIVIKEFELERSILENADHPNIVRFLGSGHEPRRFVVLEYLNQGTLGMLSNTQITFQEALQRGLGLASALNYLHHDCVPGVTIIHRDLKPDNIGLSDGMVKLFDFGLSISVKQRQHASEAYQMTGCTGTLRYMAPEVALGKPYTEKVDVYSFGILMWQLATSRVPFRRATKSDFMDCVVRDGYRPPMHPQWPPAFVSLLQGCWNADPSLRFSFRDVVPLLESLLNTNCSCPMEPC